MPDSFSDDQLTQALRDGLRAQPVPMIAADFDARILIALRMPEPWWRRLWPAVRPVLLGACGSTAVTLVLMHWAVSTPTVMIQTISVSQIASHPSHILSPDALLDRPGLHAGSLMTAWTAPPPKRIPKRLNRRAQIDSPLA